MEPARRDAVPRGVLTILCVLLVHAENAAGLAIFRPVDAALKDGALSEAIVHAVAKLVAPRVPAALDPFSVVGREGRLTGTDRRNRVFFWCGGL